MIKISQKLPESYDRQILFCFEDELNEEATGNYRAFDLEAEFKGDRRELHTIYALDDSHKLTLFGLGKSGVNRSYVQDFQFLLTKKSNSWKAEHLVFDLRKVSDQIAQDCALGIGLSKYQIGHLKTEKNEIGDPQIVLLIGENKNEVENLINSALLTADSMNRVKALVDLPSNVKTPVYLKNWVIESGKKFGYTVRIKENDALLKEGFHALLAVNQGSVIPPFLVEMEYNPHALKKNKPDVGLVGKGVSFDTGGISLKPSNNMQYMKSDMGGAAAVFGAMELAARLKLNKHLVAVVPITENCVDGASIKPGDVISSYSGKSIEVIDTDAEGRLILADGISYMLQKYNPEVMLDLATLTGSCVRALGYEASGLFSTNVDLVEQIEKAGRSCFERTWRFPMWDNYAKGLKSDVADIKNLSGKPVAGAISAAKFLEFFTDDHPRWAHLDIAGVAFGDSEFSKLKAATGYGVRLLLELFKSRLN